jgi:hypothetical protein
MMRPTSFIRLLGLLMLPIIAAVVGTHGQALAQSTSQAAIVVTTGEGTTENRCVAFEGEDIAGLDLLKGSGFDTEFDVKGFGSAICSISGVGCAADDCFCKCGGVGECVYWSYWHLEEDGWQYAASGASSYRVSHGDVDGWTWGPGSITRAIEPPGVSFEEICSDSSAVINLSERGQEAQESSAALFLVPIIASIIVGYGLIRYRRSARTP